MSIARNIYSFIIYSYMKDNGGSMPNDEQILDELVKMDDISIINLTSGPDEDDHSVLHGQSQSEISKLKLFMEVFNALSINGQSDVNGKVFIKELISTGRFTEKEANEVIIKAIQNGHIYERRSGWYAKA